MTTFLRSPAPFIFRWKWIAALALAILADWLFFEQPAGWTLGLYAAIVLAVFLLFRPAVLRQAAGQITAGLLLGLSLACVEAPNSMVAMLILPGFATLALLSLGRMPSDAFAWLGQVAIYLASGWQRPFRDGAMLLRWKRKHPQGCGFNWQWLVPLGFSLVFIHLFSQANPLIQHWLAMLDWDFLAEALKPTRLMYLGFMGFTLWAFLRPYRWFRMHQGVGRMARALPGWRWYLSDASVLQGSLVLFNGIFLLQTVMDALYLWGGVRLPDGMSYADYAHRGAYPLIFTALLAGLFVLVSMRPGSDSGRSPVIRGLVSLWILQNVFLTISSILRTLLYIEAYSLTHWRVAAIIWMGLVGLGLVLVLWRILRDLPNRWLINANALALLVVLCGCSVVDFNGMIAWYNVQHSKEAAGHGPPLDLSFLEWQAGAEALPALAWYETHARMDDFARTEVRLARARMTASLVARQADWRQWTWRNHRLLKLEEAIQTREIGKVMERDGWQPLEPGDGRP